MKALLLGSIGTLSDTSELQREAFNAAFRAHDLPWIWDRDAYRQMLRRAGGAGRVARQAEAEGREVDAVAIHATKSRLFQEMLDAGRAVPRPGIVELIREAREAEVPVAFVTTTLAENVDRLLSSLGLDRGDFTVVIDATDVLAPKPDPDCYLFAAARVVTPPEHCLAIEDNVDGVEAALAAGVPCLAWPNANTEGHDFGPVRVVSGNIREVVRPGRMAAE
jgi:HAD superfamily hydrolase (TIGR01509 family)